MTLDEAIEWLKDLQSIGLFGVKEYRQAINITINALSSLQPVSLEPLTCNGCAYEAHRPSEIHCQGCCRMYTDHYCPPEGEKK